MQHPIRVLAGGLGLAALVMAIAAACGCGSGSTVRDDGAEGEDDSLTARERRRSEHLNEQIAEVQGRTEAKLRLEADLLHGRIPFAKAVEMFRAIQKRSPHGRRLEREMEAEFPLQSDWERYARALIAFIRANGDAPELAARIAVKMETELEEKLRRDKGIAPAR